MAEGCTYPAGLILGFWFTSLLPLTRAGFFSAFLLLLATTLATLCTGLLFTLRRHDFPGTGSSEADGPR